MSKKKPPTLSEELTELWARQLETVLKTKIPKAKYRKLESYIQRRIFSHFNRSGGVFALRRDTKGKLITALVIRQGSLVTELKQKHSSWSILVFSMPGDQTAIKWVRERLLENKIILSQGCEGYLEPWQKPLLPIFKKLGIHPTSIILIGSVSSALKKLKKHYGKSIFAPLITNRLTITPAKSKADVDSYIEVIRREFTRNPQFGTFVTSPHFLKGIRDEALKSVKKGKTTLWVVKRGSKILGGSDYSANGTSLNGEKGSSFGVNLDKSLQGKGIARVLYATMLAELHRQGFGFFRGGTAQPGVMRISRILGRKLDGIRIESSKKPLFPPNHFKGWI